MTTPPANARYIISCFSALQRAEIAEMLAVQYNSAVVPVVSVLFNEPKLLKFPQAASPSAAPARSFSALQRAEIAEMTRYAAANVCAFWFQCSSTSRNC